MLVIAAAALDYSVRTTDHGLRILLSATLATLLLAVVWRFFGRWRRERWNEPVAAQALQRRFPTLGDKLASALEFLRQDEHDPTAGSAPLRRAVIAEASAALDELPAEQVAERRSMPCALSLAMMSLLVVFAFLLLAPQSSRTALTRLVAPWDSVEWPRRNNLEFVDPPNLLARGETFEASLTDSGGNLPDEVEIEYRYTVDGRKRTDKTWMQRVGDTMVARRENVNRSFDYRATGGDHQSMPWRSVEVVDPPTATDVVFHIHPPAYTGLEIVSVSGKVRAVSGSKIGLISKASQPLKSAALVGGSPDPIAAEIRDEEISLPSQPWSLSAGEQNESLRPTLELVAKNGLQANVALPLVELVVDQPPQVSWLQPTDDQFAVSGAALPIEVSARDELALKNVRLTISPSSDGKELPAPAPVYLYTGSNSPPKHAKLPRGGERLDTQSLSYQLDLAPLELPAGTVIELGATADDYKPQTGTVDRPRRITIVTAAEVDSQLAESQADLLRLLEQALADQRAAREQSKRAGQRATQSTPVDRDDLDNLLSARLAQQAVRRTLSGADRGVINVADALLGRLRINRLQRPELVAHLEQIRDAVRQLADDPLPTAEQILTDLRKVYDSKLGTPAAASETTKFAALDGEQQRVIDVLEKLITGANEWSDSDRFVRELARLESDQRRLREQSLDAARRNLLAQSDRKVQPVEPADQQRLAAEQADIARRFDRLAQSMRKMAQSDAIASDLAARLQDALSEAESNQLSAQLAGIGGEIADGKLGRAAETQQAAADALRELIDRLRDRSPNDPGELAAKLRSMQRELEQLKQQAQDAQRQGDPQQQAAERRDLEQKLARAARELARLTAQAASQSTARASNSAAPQQGESKQQAQEKLEQAKRDIDQAQRELAKRIAALEGERQQRLLDRLAEVLADLIPRHQEALERTLQLELVRETTGGLGDAQRRQASNLSTTENHLADKLGEAIADVEKRAVFQLALGGAAADMRQAAQGLEQLNTGRLTQSLQLSALSRMRHVLDVLRDQPPPPPEGEQSSGGGSGGGNQPQQPPLIELAEVKMLRWLQVELNNRTRLFEADLADNATLANQEREVAERLAAEQHQLEELVREMMRRNNKSVQRPVEL